MGTGVGMFERDRVMAAVDHLVDRLAAGRGGALFVVGEAGLGKTSVLEHARTRGAGSGLIVTVGRGHPMETAVPFGLATQALDRIGGRGLLTGPPGRPDAAGPAGLGGSAGAACGDERAARLYAVLRWLDEQR